MTKKPDELPDDVSPPAAAQTDRRQRDRSARPPRLDPKALGGISHDDLGNAVWEWRVDVPRRRDDDPTIDLIDCLDVDGMSLEDEKPATDEDESFNPYNKSR
jgi:hypothetical protein